MAAGEGAGSGGATSVGFASDGSVNVAAGAVLADGVRVGGAVRVDAAEAFARATLFLAVTMKSPAPPMAQSVATAAVLRVMRLKPV